MKERVEVGSPAASPQWSGMMPHVATCEVSQRRSPWEVCSADRAVGLGRLFEKRCIECHGRVRVLKESGTIAAHCEHILAHKGSSLDPYYDGKGPRLHPVVVI